MTLAASRRRDATQAVVSGLTGETAKTDIRFVSYGHSKNHSWVLASPDMMKEVVPSMKYMNH